MRRLVIAVALLAGLVWLAASSDAPRLATGDGSRRPEGGYGVGLAVPSRAETRNFAESNLCLAGDASMATVTGIEFLESQHLRILEFGVREYPITEAGLVVDVTRGSLHEAGFLRVPVTVPCGDGDRVAFLGFVAAIDGAEDGWGKRLAVSYVVDGRPGRLVLPISVRMCVSETLEPDCMPGDL